MKNDVMPLPRIEQALEALAGSTFFSAMDAVSGFWQIKVGPETQRYLAFSTHRGTFLWERMPMGPKTAPATY